MNEHAGRLGTVIHCPAGQTVVQTLLVTASLLFGAATAHAAADLDTLWVRAKKVLEANKNWVAGSTATDMEMFEGNGKSLGTLHIEEQVAGWENGEPTRKMTHISNPDHQDVAKGRFKVVVDNHPDQALKDGTSLTRLETGLLAGKTCVLFRVTGLTGKKGNVQFKSQVWIEEATGLPLKVIHEFDGLPMTKAMKHTILFGAGEDGRWLPTEAVVDGTVAAFFQRARIVSKYRFGKWMPRPGEASAK